MTPFRCRAQQHRYVEGGSAGEKEVGPRAIFNGLGCNRASPQPAWGCNGHGERSTFHVAAMRRPTAGASSRPNALPSETGAPMYFSCVGLVVIERRRILRNGRHDGNRLATVPARRGAVAATGRASPQPEHGILKWRGRSAAHTEQNPGGAAPPAAARGGQTSRKQHTEHGPVNSKRRTRFDRVAGGRFPNTAAVMQHEAGKRATNVCHSRKETALNSDMPRPNPAPTIGRGAPRSKRYNELSFNDLLFRAHSLHRASRSTRTPCRRRPCLSIKTGACPEDCAVLPAEHPLRNRRRFATKLMPLDEGPPRQRGGGARREAGRQRASAWGASYRGPKDSQLEPILAMIEEVKKRWVLEDLRDAGLACGPARPSALAAAGLDYYNHNLDSSPEFYGQDHHHGARTPIGSRRFERGAARAGVKVCWRRYRGYGRGRVPRSRRPAACALATHEPAPRERAHQTSSYP